MAENGVDIAQAYVHLIPSMEGSERIISDELTDGADKAGDKAGKKAGDGFLGSWKKKVTAAAGAGLAAGFMMGFGNAVEQGDTTAKLGAVLNLTGPESERAGAVAGNLYAGAYGESLGEVGGAVDAVMSSMSGMRDASSADLEKITGYAMNLAKGFDVDVAESVAAAGVMINNGLAPDAESAMNLITASMQQVPQALRGEVLPVMSEYSKHFAGLGIDGEQALGMIVAASENGAIGMDKMGDAVKEFQIRSTDLSKSTGAAYETLGLDMESMTNKLLEGGPAAQEAMGQIVSGLQKVKDPGEQAAAAIALFGTPLEDMSVDQIPAFLSALQPAPGALGDIGTAADDFGNKLNGGPGTALTELKRAVETSFGSMLTVAMPAIQTLTGFITENQWVIGAFAALLGGVLLASFVSWTAGMVASNIAMAQMAGGAVVSAARVVGAWVVSLSQTIAIMALYAAQAVASAARAAAAWVASSARTIASLALTAGQFVLQGALMAASFAATVARVVAGWVLMGAQALLNGARIALGWVIAMGPIAILIAAIAAVVAAIIWVATQTTFFQDVWAVVWGAIKAAIAAAGAFIRTTLTNISNWWSSTWAAIKAAAAAVWAAIKSVVSSSINAVRSVVFSVLGAVSSWWRNTWTAIRAAAAAVWSGIVSLISGAINGVRSTITNVLNGIRSIWSSIWGGLSGAARSAWNGITGFFSGAVGRVSGIFGRIGSAIMSPFRNAFNSIAGFWNRTVGQISFTVPDWVPGVGGRGFSVPSIPMLATGGVVTKPTLAMVGEGAEHEAVLPLSKLNRMLETAAAGGGGDGLTVNGPLVSLPGAVLDSSDRVKELSQAIYSRADRSKRARGRSNSGGIDE